MCLGVRNSLFTSRFWLQYKVFVLYEVFVLQYKVFASTLISHVTFSPLLPPWKITTKQTAAG